MSEPGESGIPHVTNQTLRTSRSSNPTLGGRGLMPTEADTCRIHVLLGLYAAGGQTGRFGSS